MKINISDTKIAQMEITVNRKMVQIIISDTIIEQMEITVNSKMV